MKTNFFILFLRVLLFLGLFLIPIGVTEEEVLIYARMESPFRMQKINLLWDKVRRSNQIRDEYKLKTLFDELKIHEKEEFTLKRLKSENKDKEGLFEASVRKKFNNILKKYSLGYYADEDVKSTSQHHDSKQTHFPIFKDKKLNKLWDKASKLGLSENELLILKQELLHHQENVDEYHRLLDLQNSYLEQDLSDQQPIDELRSKKKQEIKDEYEDIHKRIFVQDRTKNDEAFTDPKVQSLWKLALEADFNDKERESIKKELLHYSKRLEKMKFLEAELNMVDERHDGMYNNNFDKTEGRKLMDNKLKKHMETAEKIQRDLEERIASRHSEL